MSDYRLVIEEIKEAKAITSYTRWVDAVQARGGGNPGMSGGLTFHLFNACIERFHLPKHRHWIAGKFGIMSDEMKTSLIRLGDDEAVERIAVKCGKRRKGEDVFKRNWL
jgi:hypothetical protein